VPPSTQPAPPASNRPAVSGKDASLYQFFAPGGILSRTHPAYEFRRGQLQMAEAVEQALEEKRHLIVEAGTGTGKTLAYLVPVIRSGKRVIISTGTKNLQEQLFYKDVPFLEQALAQARVGAASHAVEPRPHPGTLSVCYMKGRNNYLCRKKLYDLTSQPVLSGLEEINHFRIISEWEKTTETGDRAELADLPEASHLWPKLDARTDRCIGGECPQFDRCFITEMRRRAAESDIIIVNHHLFCADLAIKMATDQPDAGVLPEAGVVVFDEAHELEDVAANYFGVGVSNLRIDDLLRDVDHGLRQADIPVADVMHASARVREHSQLFFACLPPGDGRFAFENRAEFLEENGDEYLGLQNALTHLYTELQAIQNKPEEVHAMARRVEELRVQLGFILEAQERNTVFWIERRGDYQPSGPRESPRFRRGSHNVFLQATPITVADILRNSLFEQLESAVLTSATLAVAGGFQYIRDRLGIQNAREIVVPSHFNYEQQALLYVPPDLPDPRDPRFVRRAANRVKQLLDITRGRAFCLFTSYALMHQMYEQLLGELSFPMLLQGDAPKNALLEEFRMTPNAVLFATASFWQGVDVQGEQLSCVIIDKLPFAVPNDPVVAARIRTIDEDGGNAFFDYQVPSAVISLKQGFGRLIRSLHDRGLLCLLDNRVLNKRYGRVFLESLPRYSRTTDVKVVEGFFGVQA
jgi:ATP-dependent DNA helicase DinG